MLLFINFQKIITVAVFVLLLQILTLTFTFFKHVAIQTIRVNVSGDCGPFECNKVSWKTLISQSICLEDHRDSYFVPIAGKLCFKRGTDVLKSQQVFHCVCLPRYNGNDCGIPDPIWYTLTLPQRNAESFKRRATPRRVIHALIVNKEFEMFNIRLNELKDIVDVFIVGESNYSMTGEKKPLSFQETFRMGFMRQFFNRIIYVQQTFFPQGAETNGWLGESYPRKYTSEEGLPRVQNLRDDDLFLTFDADEIPSREVITFLKLYDGYDEPITFRLRWSVFGYYWDIRDMSGLHRPTTIVAGCTVGFLREHLGNNANSLRGYGGGGWTIGTADQPAGHHCSWCMSIEGIIAKLKNANKEDKPRWGDFPEKLNPHYIKKLRQFGVWFSETDFFTRGDVTNEYFAPGYAMTNKEAYKSLLRHPSLSLQ